NGTGVVVPSQSLVAGSSISAYAIARDAGGNFLSNTAATWSLQSITGGVVSGDLVPAGGNKSATFTGHLVGSAVIHEFKNKCHGLADHRGAVKRSLDSFVREEHFDARQHRQLPVVAGCKRSEHLDVDQQPLHDARPELP